MRNEAASFGIGHTALDPVDDFKLAVHIGSHGLAREEADRQVGDWERRSPAHRLDDDAKPR